MAEESINIGANVNCRIGRVGGSILHWAAVYADRYMVIRTLIAMGANINALDNEGNTPLEAALKYGAFVGGPIQALLECGAKLPSTWELMLEENSNMDSYGKECLMEVINDHLQRELQ